MSKQLSVLVVDDSAVFREFMTALLSRDPSMRVRVAADPLFAREKIKAERPDVILLDLEMPRQHGLTFLKQLMATDPVPIVVFSSFAGPGTEAAMQALDDGAVDVVGKPEFGMRGFLEENATVLIDKVRAASMARLRPRRALRSTVPVVNGESRMPGYGSVIAIGASTGGTEAIQTILQTLPANCPPVVITQHMPAGFTRAFANRLDRLSNIEVREASSGDTLCAGRALVAPGNMHMAVQRAGDRYVINVYDGALVSRHRPSVDVLFESVAEVAGRRSVGALLTGMGDDGARGLLRMKQSGAHTIAQDEATCVVFGMPSEAIRRGAADRVLPIGAIAGAIMQHVSESAQRAIR